MELSEEELDRLTDAHKSLSLKVASRHLHPSRHSKGPGGDALSPRSSPRIGKVEAQYMPAKAAEVSRV